MPAEEPSPLPFPGSTFQGPDPRSARLRARRPAAQVAVAQGGSAGLVTRYEDIRSPAADHRFSRAAVHALGAPQLGGLSQAPPAIIVSLDPPDPTRPRRLTEQASDAARARPIAPRVTEPVDRLPDELAAKRASGEAPTDPLDGFATPLALTVTCELLDAPQADRDRLHDWERQLAAVGGPKEEAIAAREQLGGYIAGLVTEKREHPADDILSAPIADHPDTWRAPGEDPSLVPAAVKELLQGVNLFATDTPGLPRIATQDVTGASSPPPPRTRCPWPPPTATPRSSPPRPAGLHPRRQPPSGLRRRHPPLHGRAAGAPGDRHRRRGPGTSAPGATPRRAADRPAPADRRRQHRPARPARPLVNRPRQPRSHP